MEKISVFLADWQVLFREGIHFTLSGEEDLDVIGETTDNQEALDFIISNPPRIAILNANNSELTGINLTRSIQQDLPLVSVILVMDSDNEEQVYAALKCGASACVTKDIDPDNLVRLIREIAAGAEPITQALLRPGIAPRVIDEFDGFALLNKEVDNLLASLSPRESEVLRHVADGDTIEDISTALEISEDTVNQTLTVIRKKLVSNDHNRDVIEAAQRGLSPVSRSRRSRSSEEYITKEEFDAFKESLRERFKSLSES